MTDTVRMLKALADDNRLIIFKTILIGETQMCLLNKYFNEQIDACRSTGCKCKCGCC